METKPDIALQDSFELAVLGVDLFMASREAMREAAAVLRGKDSGSRQARELGGCGGGLGESTITLAPGGVEQGETFLG